MKVRLDAWIEGLKYDWNITRQRFYGVPFPVWYCDGCGAVVLATEDELPVDPLESSPVTPCPKCGGTAFVGDPDVMDTWMTSSLTPHINANWAHSPDRPPPAPLPMTLRVQAYEIIRTWLFYTLVKSHLHDNTLPWTDVMMSGWGLNEQGKKFSKRDLEAKKDGQFNKYDPEDVIDKYGADALRFWAAGSHLGHDLRYHEEDVKVGRKLVLKLWNVARLVEQYAPDFDPSTIVSIAQRTPEDRWIVGQLERLLPVVTRGFETYDYAIAAKRSTTSSGPSSATTTSSSSRTGSGPRTATPTPSAASARSTLWEVLRTLLGLYAPFLPFVTEELYQYMYAAHEEALSIHVTRWPDAPAALTPKCPRSRRCACCCGRCVPSALGRGCPKAVRSPNSSSTPTNRDPRHARSNDPEPRGRGPRPHHPLRLRRDRDPAAGRAHRHRPEEKAEAS